VAKIIQFPQPQGKFLASVDLFLEPDGTILARLADMAPSVIESIPGEAFDKMLKLALWTAKGSESLAEQAESLREPQDV